MCEPTTIMMGVSLAMSAVMAAQQARAQSQAAKHQQQVAEQNQERAEQQADDALLRSEIEQRQITEQAATDEQQFRVEAAKERGGMAAALASNGSLITAGTSAGQSLVQARERTEIDANRIQSNAEQARFTVQQQGEQEAYGLRVQANDFANQSQLAASRARNARVAGGLGVASSIVGGASKVSGQWQSYQKYQPSQPKTSYPNGNGWTVG